MLFQSAFRVDMSWFVAILLLALVAAIAADDDSEVQEALRQIADSNNEFGKDLYQMLASSVSDNMILSPFSAYAILALVWFGARGNTADEMETTLHLPDNSTVLREGFRAFFKNSTENEDILRLANGVFIQEGSKFEESFLNVAIEDFEAEVKELDFSEKTEESRIFINKWVENITDNKIQNLPPDLEPDTNMILVNAIYFYGTWKYQFKESDTRDETFYTSSDSQVTVPMMHLKANLGSVDLNEFKARALELKYKDDLMRMIVILPNEIDGLQYVEERLCHLNITNIRERIVDQQTDLSLPKLEIESTWKLEEFLPQMGMKDLFTTDADLSGISDGGLVVDQVMQKAFVQMSEKGTEAAAATAVVVVSLSSVICCDIKFLVNHPFILLLVNQDDNILFMGRVVNPKN